MELLGFYSDLPLEQFLLFVAALVVAFGFEFVNGFHDTANAVATVIYTRSLPATPAVIFSGFLNFLGVLMGGTAVAFTIVNLLPVDILIEASPRSAMMMVLSLLSAGIIWNLGTWLLGLPVSSSHALIGSIMGAGLANGIIAGRGMGGLNWEQVLQVAESLTLSLVIGFAVAGGLLLLMKSIIRDPRLYSPPHDGEHPPSWIRGVLIFTCGGVSFAHGSNDGQKGMGLILLVLIGFLPGIYSVNTESRDLAQQVHEATLRIKKTLEESQELTTEAGQRIAATLKATQGVFSFRQIDRGNRWQTRKTILELKRHLTQSVSAETHAKVHEELVIFNRAIEFVPLWVVVGVALALGVGTTVGYKRIVVTVAEKIGKAHLTYAQGAAAEITAAATIALADMIHMPVSTTQVLSSGVAGTMVANKSGVQGSTIKKIILAWFLTFPAVMTMSATFYFVGHFIFGY